MNNLIYDEENDKMFDEVPISGKPYKFGDWKKYAIHDEQSVKGFFGDFRFLSNFYDATVYYEGLKYHSTENAYQSAKIDIDYRHHLQICTAAESKREWKKYPKIDSGKKEWDGRKYDVMALIVFDKFWRNHTLRKALLETGEKYLEELNHWKDTCWGVDIEKGGTNWLGKILMNTRKYFKLHDLTQHTSNSFIE